MSKVKNNQVMVSYRVDTFTSKVSVQPALIEALDVILEAEGSELNGKQWCSKKAAFAKANGVKKVSAYVREIATKKALPKEVMASYSTDLKTHDISYRINGNGLSTTLTVGGALLHYIKQITNGAAPTYLAKIASVFHNAKTDENNDISFLVRESIIQSALADRMAQAV